MDLNIVRPVICLAPSTGGVEWVWWIRHPNGDTTGATSCDGMVAALAEAARSVDGGMFCNVHVHEAIDSDRYSSMTLTFADSYAERN